MYSTKTLTHDFAFLAHFSTNCVTSDQIYLTKFWTQQLNIPPLNLFFYFRSLKAHYSLAAQMTNRQMRFWDAEAPPNYNEQNFSMKFQEEKETMH